MQHILYRYIPNDEHTKTIETNLPPLQKHIYWQKNMDLYEMKQNWKHTRTFLPYFVIFINICMALMGNNLGMSKNICSFLHI